MSDLNILGMIRGEAPGYVPESDGNGQKLAVLLMVSDTDIGRSYGGGYAMMSGRANDPDSLSLDVSSTLTDVLAWMQDNDDTLPNDFTASVESVIPGEDSLSVSIQAGPEDQLTTTTINI